VSPLLSLFGVLFLKMAASIVVLSIAIASVVILVVALALCARKGKISRSGFVFIRLIVAFFLALRLLNLSGPTLFPPNRRAQSCPRKPPQPPFTQNGSHSQSSMPARYVTGCEIHAIAQDERSASRTNIDTRKESAGYESIKPMTEEDEEKFVCRSCGRRSSSDTECAASSCSRHTPHGGIDVVADHLIHVDTVYSRKACPRDHHWSWSEHRLCHEIH
jgi:hypothetical protein